MDIGIDAKGRKKVADALEQVLADTFALYSKTHGYHWNVEGPRFSQLHLLFETQYNELWNALDGIAERMRELGSYAPALESVGSKSAIPVDNGVPSDEQMLTNLVAGNEAVVKSARACMKTADEAGDQVTVDLMSARCAAGEKAAWMLRAHHGK
ncbi:MAG: DNA starvation/stationary phase protection protein [Alphaproteobacteria bacterium]|nr:DNA starvation/stationary phase protection protein [Alphaproteobacteria bacterium]